MRLHLQRHRRRTSIVRLLATALLAGCGSESPGARAPAAVAGPDTLSTETLSNWMVLGQPLPISVEVAEGLAQHWAEVSALALRGPDRLRESGFADSVMWPQVRGAVLDSVLARRLPAPEPPPPPMVDSIFRDGRLRMIARVLRRASPEAHPEERQRQRDEAFAIHRALTQGASWNEAVARSEDQATRARGGLLGLVGPGELEPGLERAAFSLEPGAISPVLETREGYQILYRPRLEDVRPLLAEELRQRQAARERAALLDSLVADRAPALVGDAGGRLQSWAGSPAPDGSGSPVARWDGGVLPDTAAARYLTTLSPWDRARLLDGPEAAAAELASEIAGQEILWSVLAPSDDSTVDRWSSGASAAARTDWLAALDTVEAALDLGGGPESRRSGIARYMESVVSRRRSPLVLPPPAVGLAIGDHRIRIDRAGLQAAVDRARRLLAEAGTGGR